VDSQVQIYKIYTTTTTKSFPTRWVGYIDQPEL